MKTFSSTFTKTLSSGISALVGGKQQYYILEHLVASHYHQAGEKQEVMLDEVILGRDTDCHVRFDESFSTVSRHHASIKRDGDNWRLIQMSKKNTTFLNGKAIQSSWYLQSGDEIQLAMNGPKLIFRIPTETTEFKFTQRLNAFKEQVVRPYQTAVIVVCCVIVLIIAGGVTAGVVIKKQHDGISRLDSINENQRKQIEQQITQINGLYDQLLQMNEQLEQTALRADAAQKEAIKAKSMAFKERAERIKSQENMQDVQTQMEQLKDEMNSFYNGIINGENQ